jgi:peroxiredoxin
MLRNTLIGITLLTSIWMSIYASDTPTPKQPGEKINDFTLKGIDGNSYTLSEVKNSKAVVVIFWSTTCPNVQPYNDRVSEMTKEYGNKGITIWAINSNNSESLDEVKAHAEKNNYPFPMLKDENNVVADYFGATRTPEVFVMDPSSRTILYHGRIDDNRDASKVTTNDLRNALDEIAGGKDITVKNTKFFGCSIKRIE